VGLPRSGATIIFGTDFKGASMNPKESPQCCGTPGVLRRSGFNEVFRQGLAFYKRLYYDVVKT